MAKKSLITKNQNKQNLINKFRNKREKLKKLLKSKELSMEKRFTIQNKLNDLPKSSSRVRYRNRCTLTGRSRGVYRKFGQKVTAAVGFQIYTFILYIYKDVYF